MNKSKKIVIFVPLIAVFLFLFVAVGYAYPQEDIETPIWTSAKLPSRCVSPADCETSSPVLVDLTGDGLVDIVVATSNGHIVAIGGKFSACSNSGLQFFNGKVALHMCENVFILSSKSFEMINTSRQFHSCWSIWLPTSSG